MYSDRVWMVSHCPLKEVCGKCEYLTGGDEESEIDLTKEV